MKKYNLMFKISQLLNKFYENTQNFSELNESKECIIAKNSKENESYHHTVEYLHKKQQVCLIYSSYMLKMSIFTSQSKQQLIEECAAWGEKYQMDIEAKELELNNLLKERDSNISILDQLKARYSL